MRVGDTITLEMGGREHDWEIVGIARSVLAGPYGYVNYPWFARVTRSTGLASESASASQLAWATFPGVYGYYSVRGAKPGATVYARYSDPPRRCRRRAARLLGWSVLRLGTE